VYRGIYQWEGAAAAAAYAGRMVGLLAPFSNRGTRGTTSCQGCLEPGTSPTPDATLGGEPDAWWRLAQPVTRV